jgi:hypothetical protein
MAYFSFLCRHSLDVLVGPVQAIAVTMAGGRGLFWWLPDDSTVIEKID